MTTPSFSFGGGGGGGFDFGAGAAGGGFNFGAPATNTGAAPAANAFGFGDTGNAFGFGNTGTTNNTNTGSTGFNFGFGAPADTTSTNTGFNFGSTGNTGSSTNAFGFDTGASTNAFGFGAPNPAQNQQNDLSDSPDPKLKQLEQAYSLQNPKCRFQFMFYNKMDPRQVAQYQQRPPYANDRLWKQAERNNPDRTSLVVCHARGFVDLKKRIQQQEKASQVYQKKLDVVQRIISDMKQTHEATTKTQIAQFRRAHLELAHRLLRLMNRIQQNRARGSFLVPEEVSFYKNLASIKRELSRPAQFQARVNEIQATVRMREEQPMESAHVVSADNLTRIKTFLEMQSKALKFLTDVLQKDLRDLDVLVEGLRAVPSRHGPNSSTNARQGSQRMQMR